MIVPRGVKGADGIRGPDGVKGPLGVRCDTTVLDALIAEHAVKRAAFEARPSRWRRIFHRW